MFEKMLDKSKEILTVQEIYSALFLFLWLRMCLFTFPAAIVCAALVLFKRKLLSLPLFFFISISSLILEYNNISITLICALIGFIGLLISTRIKTNPDVSLCFNNLRILLFAMIAMLIIDFSCFGFALGAKITYFYLESSYSMYRIFNIFILTSLIKILNAFIKNIKTCAFIVFNILFAFGIINFWVTIITNKAFTIADIYLAKTAAGVMEGVQVTREAITLFIVFIIMIIVFNTLLGLCKFNKIEKVIRIKSGAVSFGAFLIMFLAIFNALFNPLIFNSEVKMGLISHLIVNAKGLDEPNDYDEFLSKDSLPDKEIKGEKSGPNIIVVMSEAFSDLKTVGDFETNIDYMPNTSKIMKEHPSGVLYSSVRGNNTCSSEYEFLTGVPTGLTETGGVIYQKYMDEKEDSLVSLLEKQGYKTVGIHPYKKFGYNRFNAWKSFGFDEMYFDEDFVDAAKVRDFISDESFYNKIIEEYENKGENPMFCFGISMQNHATYLTDYEGDIKVKNMNYKDVDEYLSLIKITDEETAKLLKYFDSVDEDTIIVFFGDHQPMIEEGFYVELLGKDLYELPLDKRSNAYEIPYFVWTNYENDFDVPKEMSINYLPNVVLNAAGLEKDSWFTFTDKVFKEFPVVSDQFLKVGGEYTSKDEMIEALNKIKYEDKNDPMYLLKQMQIYSYEKAID